MNWDEYSKMMDEKIHEAELNMKYAEQKFREAKAVYDSLLLQKKSYEDALDELMEGKK